MSDSVRPHRRQPTRLPRPWDSPGKKTGVGCPFLLQCMKVKSESEVAQLCPTLSNPMNCSPPGSSVHGIFQARVAVLIWQPLAQQTDGTLAMWLVQTKMCCEGQNTQCSSCEESDIGKRKPQYRLCTSGDVSVEVHQLEQTHRSGGKY